MRLINVKTLKLEVFDDHPPAYAILSHTWGDEAEELNFRDVQEGNTDKPGIGAVKLHGCCRQAAQDGFDYAWIDTCCIDKTNLVELSEAINSMFRWYSDAAVCYAYLSDVAGGDDGSHGSTSTSTSTNNSNTSINTTTTTTTNHASKELSGFHNSRWFRRGWTLQELLAPEHVRFYSADWASLGNKGSLCAAIGKITGVPRHFLLGITDLHAASVAQRMSWAAGRDTKRKEDLAYCLLGLFGVTMPLIYGEGGEQAFFRLQEQIMKTTRDDSILAWGLDSTSTSTSTISTTTATTSITTTTTVAASIAGSDSDQVIAGRILAAAPADFAGSGQIVPRDPTPTLASPSALDMSGGSLRISLSLCISPDGETLALLNCRPENDDDHVVAIPLVKTTALSEEYVRPKGDLAMLQPLAAAAADAPTPIHIRHESDKKVSRLAVDAKKQYWLYEDEQFADAGLDLIDVEPRVSWDRERALITSSTRSDGTAHRTLVRLRQRDDGRSNDTTNTTNGNSNSSDSTSISDYITTSITRSARSNEKAPRDFIIVLEFEETDSGSVKAKCCLMVCCRNTESGEIVAKLDYLVQRASGARSASNGFFNFDVSLEPEAQRPIFIIRPRVTSSFSSASPISTASSSTVTTAKSDTVDATVELDKFDLMLDFTIILQDRTQIDVKSESLARAALEKIKRLEQVKSQREALDEEMRKLGERRRLLLDDETNLRAHVYQLGDEQDEMRNLQQEVDDRWQVAQARWTHLHHPNESPGSTPTADGQTPLLWASERGDADTVRLLLYQGADAAAANRHGHTPFSVASANGHLDVVRILLEADAIDVNARDDDGQTPLCWAAENGFNSLAALLLNTGKAQLNVKDSKGWTALRWATEKKNEALIKLLLEHGAVGETLTSASTANTSKSNAGNNTKSADYSKAIDSRLLEMLARTSSMGVIRGKASRSLAADDKKPRARTWFNLDGKKPPPVNVVIAETPEESTCTRRSTA